MKPFSNKKNQSITVITLTRNRLDLLQRCMRSVKKQDYCGKVSHLLVIDDCPETSTMLKRNYQENANLAWMYSKRGSYDHSGPQRLARLRNQAVNEAQTQWVCFLDDDNEFEPFHLCKLMACAQQSGSPAVHAWLQLFNFDGTPYLRERWPWCRDDDEGKKRYQEMVDRGVITPGSNILRDNIHNLPYRCVDTSAWLLKRQLLIDHPIPSNFSYEEWINNKAEDDKLQIEIMKFNISVVCNKVASVRYYLGGFSTNHDGNHRHSQHWEWQPYMKKTTFP